MTGRPNAAASAVPVVAREACALVAAEADEFACLLVPPDLLAIGEWYVDFSPASEVDVRALLVRARAVPPGAAAA